MFLRSHSVYGTSPICLKPWRHLNVHLHTLSLTSSAFAILGWFPHRGPRHVGGLVHSLFQRQSTNELPTILKSGSHEYCIGLLERSNVPCSTSGGSPQLFAGMTSAISSTHSGLGCHSPCSQVLTPHQAFTSLGLYPVSHAKDRRSPCMIT